MLSAIYSVGNLLQPLTFCLLLQCLRTCAPPVAHRRKCCGYLQDAAVSAMSTQNLGTWSYMVRRPSSKC